MERRCHGEVLGFQTTCRDACDKVRDKFATILFTVKKSIYWNLVREKTRGKSTTKSEEKF